MKGREPDSKKVEFFTKQMLKSLEQFQEYFLDKGKFISGNQISFADILAACEIEQTRKYVSLLLTKFNTTPVVLLELRDNSVTSNAECVLKYCRSLMTSLI